MIRLIEALNFRCLRYVRQSLGPFHVLVGPNASGKTTFLDVVAFLGRMVSDGLDAAVSERTENFYDLLWRRKGSRFALAIEADVPEEFRIPPQAPRDVIRYEVTIDLSSLDARTRKTCILEEQIRLVDAGTLAKPSVLAGAAAAPRSIALPVNAPQWQPLLRPFGPGVYDATAENSWRDGRGRKTNPGANSYDLLVEAVEDRGVLSALNPARFPASAWLRGLLRQGVRHYELSSAKLRRPSPPGKGIILEEDGGNLPWVVSSLCASTPKRFNNWLRHLQTALPDVAGIRVVERPEDKHRYLMVRYRNGLEVPSWMLSDGTLRLLALTVLPYALNGQQICLIEEPETSIHPLNIESVLQSLSSMHGGQVLVATHSPAVLAASRLDLVLVFSRDAIHGTYIVRGNSHPALKDWKGQPNLSVLFASGVLG